MSAEFTYQVVIAAIEGWIASGRYQPGDALPAIREIADELHTSIGTVRKATDLMKDRGTLEGRQGRRLYVPANPNG